jgi:hypothetical protein
MTKPQIPAYITEERIIMANHTPAIVFVDGEEFIRCQDGDNFRAVFDETVKREGGEVALMVWKPRHGIYLREQLSITASKSEG